MTGNFLETALWYTRGGIAVLPLSGKIPRTPNGVKDATTDRGQIEKWAKLWPDANIGITGLFVPDFDIYKPGYAGGDLLAYLLANHPTTTVDTPRKGVHLWYKPTPGQALTNATGGLPSCVDVRAPFCGYVVAPPSIHPDTGTPYRFRAGLGLHQILPAPIPAIVLELIAKAEQPSEQTPRPSVTLSIDDHELVDRMLRKPGVAALWAGDIAAYADDHSSADQALCNHLAFWAGCDPDRMDRLFRQSGLYREKWERADYRERTISKAIAGCNGVYDPESYRSNGAPHMHFDGYEPHFDGADDLAADFMNSTNGHHSEMRPEPRPTKRNIHTLRNDLLALANANYDASFTTKCAVDQEVGLGRLVSDALGGNIVFDHSNGMYYWWNNVHWQIDPGDIALNIASDVATALCKRAYVDLSAELANMAAQPPSMDDDANPAADEAKRKAQMLQSQCAALLRAVKNMQKHGAIERVLKLARTSYGLGITGDLWDTNINLLGVNNGVIDLTTGKPVKPDPAQYVRTVAPVDYVPGADSPMWDRAITEIFNGDTEKVGYMQRFLGYALSATCRESDFYIWHGEHGRNGKEFILERVANTIGESLAGAIDRELFLKNRSIRGAGSSNESMMALRGRRIAWASENEEGRQLDLAAMKDLSGGHVLVAIPKYGKEQQWKRTHTPIMLTNHLPRVFSQGLAEWDRIKLLSFPLSFVSEPDPTKPEQRQKDATLGERIDAEELPGILNWLITGCLAWREHGLQPPQSVKTDTAMYKAGEDTIGLFIADQCVVADGQHCKPLELFGAYKLWIDDSEYGRPMGKKRFYHAIEKTKGFARGVYAGDERFVGIGLRI
ncbi:MAG: phage/plasmid primase, P4 family [Caldilineaceae bacterium]